MNDVSVIRISRCGITRGTFYGKHVLTLIWVIMTGGSFKIVSRRFSQQAHRPQPPPGFQEELGRPGPWPVLPGARLQRGWPSRLELDRGVLVQRDLERQLLRPGAGDDRRRHAELQVRQQ